MILLLAVAMVSSGSPDAAPVPTVAPDKKVCRVDTSTGSILPKRICHTKAQWDQLSASERHGVEQLRDREAAPSVMQQ